MKTSTVEHGGSREVSISRVMNVPAKYIFLAHSRLENWKRWFGPKGYPVTYCEADFRIGGRWRMIMTGPDGAEGPPFGGTFLDIVAHNRIVYENAFEDGKGGAMNLKHGGPMIITTTFEERDGKTTVTTSILFKSAEMKAEYLGIGMLEGIDSGFAQCEEVARELSLLG
jgi:uncharacterized protein YndB with AHSA1/START domain